MQLQQNRDTGPHGGVYALLLVPSRECREREHRHAPAHHPGAEDVMLAALERKRNWPEEVPARLAERQPVTQPLVCLSGLPETDHQTSIEAGRTVPRTVRA
jgi:hypothetical protein